MRDINYEDCLKYVEIRSRAKLHPWQKDMLKAMCGGKEFRSARGLGRTFVAKLFGQYISYLYGENDYTKQADVTFPYTVARKDYPLLDKIDIMEKEMSKEQFDKEYLCECPEVESIGKFELKEGEDAYDAVIKYVKRYFNSDEGKGYVDDVIVSLEISYDGVHYSRINTVLQTYLWGSDDMYEFLTDWWEGEKYIRILGIKYIKDLEIRGGVYETQKRS